MGRSQLSNEDFYVSVVMSDRSMFEAVVKVASALEIKLNQPTA
jgi:hypothetical protein